MEGITLAKVGVKPPVSHFCLQIRRISELSFTGKGSSQSLNSDKYSEEVECIALRFLFEKQGITLLHFALVAALIEYRSFSVNLPSVLLLVSLFKHSVNDAINQDIIRHFI